MWLFSSLVLLGCPTPPEQVNQQNNSVNVPNQQNNPSQGQPNGGTAPPNDGNQGIAENGDKEMSDSDKKGIAAMGQIDKKTGEGTDEAIPSPTEEGVDAVKIQGEPPPQSAEPTPVTDSLLIRVERVPSKGSKPEFTQDEIKEGEHITFTGSATCSDCEGSLLLRAVKFLGPNEAFSENNLITQQTIEAGEFSLHLPKDETPVALELLVDKNGDGLPSGGEYFAVIEMAGKLIPTEDRTGLDLDSSKREFFTPAPMPGTQGPK